jgi:hypothetical protein
MPPVVTPTGKALVEGYRKDILNGFEREKPRYNPVRVPELWSASTRVEVWLS